MALMLLADREARRALRRERVFRDRQDPLDKLTDEETYRRYRFTREGIDQLLERVEHSIQPDTQRSNAIPAHMQLLATLRFFATGSYYTVHGDFHDISVPSVCRIVHRVAHAVARLSPRVIQFPVHPQDVARVKHEFFEMASFPNVVGALDCTHIRLYGAPLGEAEHLYVNRKGYHSINVQATCDANYKLTSVVARWPGSTHDSAIIHGSILGERFTNGQLTGVLLGDTGYALRPWLMTPILNPATNAERRYNRSHRKSRVVIEQTFGQLKRKFPCLALGMRVAPQRACVIIRACCVLFNLSKEFGQPDLEDGDDDNADEDDDLLYEGHIHDGQLHRIMLINRYF